MTVKLNYRELQRISAERLLQKLGNDVGLIYVDGQALFKVKVVSEKDLTLDSQRREAKNGIPCDSQRNSLKTDKGCDSQATGIENNASTLTVKPTKQELQDMIHKIEGKPPDSQVPEPSIIVPWYDTSGDTVRMRDPKTKEIKVVTL